jgi:type II secretory pathway component PulF
LAAELGDRSVTVYQFRAVDRKREDSTESGTVVADNEEEARRKLQPLGYTEIRLKKLSGFTAWLKRFTADIR